MSLQVVLRLCFKKVGFIVGSGTHYRVGPIHSRLGGLVVLVLGENIPILDVICNFSAIYIRRVFNKC